MLLLRPSMYYLFTNSIPHIDIVWDFFLPTQYFYFYIGFCSILNYKHLSSLQLQTFHPFSTARSIPCTIPIITPIIPAFLVSTQNFINILLQGYFCLYIFIITRLFFVDFFIFKINLTIFFYNIYNHFIS